MSLPRKLHAHIVANTIGLDAKNGKLSACACDPHGWLLEPRNNKPISAIAFGTQHPHVLAGSGATNNGSDPDIAPYDVIGKITAAQSEPNIGIISVEKRDTHQSQARSIDEYYA